MKLSSEKKKELRQQYKQMKPDMGIFAVINKSNDKYYLETTPDLKSKINRTEFSLYNGSHPLKALQHDWQKHGADSFEIKILEQLDYDDDSKTDYTEDLELLKRIWFEKLAQGNIQFYD